MFETRKEMKRYLINWYDSNKWEQINKWERERKNKELAEFEKAENQKQKSIVN